MKVFGLLPFRSLNDPKTRLGGELDLERRRALALALLNTAVTAMLDATIERTAVITVDPRLQGIGLDPRAEVMLQTGTGLNAAIREGQQWALAHDAEGLLIVLPDLPLLSAADITALLDVAEPNAAVIAPDRHGRGTNALLLAPPDVIRPAFGTDSALRHRLALALADIPLVDIQRAGTHLDLDTPEDLLQLSQPV